MTAAESADNVQVMYTHAVDLLTHAVDPVDLDALIDVLT